MSVAIPKDSGEGRDAPGLTISKLHDLEGLVRFPYFPFFLIGLEGHSSEHSHDMPQASTVKELPTKSASEPRTPQAREPCARPGSEHLRGSRPVTEVGSGGAPDSKFIAGSQLEGLIS